LVLLKGSLMDWGDGRIEPTFDKLRRARRQRASQALVPVPAPVDAFAGVRPRYNLPAYDAATEIDYSHLNDGASPFATFCAVALIIGILLFGLSHVGPEFWETVKTVLAWMVGIAALVGFVALLNKYPNLVLPILTVCAVVITLGYLVQGDRHRRRWDD
jgi:hypothetical protein